MTGDYDTGHPCAGGRTKEGAEVARVGHSVKDEQKSRRLARAEQICQGDRRDLLGPGDHTLGRVRPRRLRQHRCRPVLDGGTPLMGKGNKLLQSWAGMGVVGYPEPVDLSVPRGKQFVDGVIALDLAAAKTGA